MDKTEIKMRKMTYSYKNLSIELSRFKIDLFHKRMIETDAGNIDKLSQVVKLINSASKIMDSLVKEEESNG